MKIKSYVLHAFTKGKAGGNLAGVVLNAEELSETDMQAIAKTLGFSETAFLLSSDQADWRIRYFTPAEEVPICGHATVALFSALKQKNIAAAGSYTIDTDAGILSVKTTETDQVFLQQNTPQYLDVLPSEEIADSLNIPADSLHDTLPVQIVSTGLKDILVPIKNLKTLTELVPDFDKITQISKKYQVTGYHIFSLETQQPTSTAHCRNFAPLFDIPEESATGTSNAALACYLTKQLDSSALQTDAPLIFEQGYSMDKPSEIIALLTQEHGAVSSIYVGGTASKLIEKEIEI
ncbi:PhzF family phenazine biosynthesis protein [Enterococcus sp. BWM-S5]|uniref:PhzF family phenazine biosynthesis protein n=1 Tax=Enterococcus larvae TaxID=2794352 RepID=A0ABS4CJH6_9ENTE|nr:PhzF family phenazine biosynthesis protein [Enterococcus larvae]MBP1046624.1 PhzF family phenazine biosynthesis protein [Enterococcus larvae]